MRTYRCHFLTIFLLSLFSSCSRSDDKISLGDEKPKIINILKAYEKRKNIKSSQIVSALEYIPIEYSEKTAFRNIGQPILLGDSAFILKSFRRISVFNNRGEYLRDIGFYGEGPNGFSSTLPLQNLRPFQTTLLAKGWKDDYIQYSIESNKIIRSIPVPKYDDEVAFESELVISSLTLLDSSNYVGYVVNLSGDQPERLAIFNESGELLKTYKNHQSFFNTPSVFFSPLEGHFYHFEDKTFFKEEFNDTIFHIDQEYLKPKFIFDLGKNSPPYYEKERIKFEERRDFIFIRDVFETERYLIFYTEFKNQKRLGIFFKEDSRVLISNQVYLEGEKLHGFENDIDNFIPFFPTRVQGNKIFGLTSANVVHTWFKNNQDAIDELPDYLRSFKDIKPDGNPVLIIGKLK